MAPRKASKADEYSNVIAIEIDESAGGTLTFEEINIGVNLFQGQAILISRVEYSPKNTTFQALTAADDSLTMAVVSSSGIANLNMDQIEVIDSIKVTTTAVGAAATGIYTVLPLVRDLSTLKGKGVLVAPRPLYAAIQSANLGLAAGAYVRIYFSIIDLNDRDYIELVQSRLYLS